jgi:AbrB family looped-hinge helix DNA binding protein
LPFIMANGKFDGMKTKKLTVDSAGRIVLPQPVRAQFHITRGSELDLEIGQGAIILRPRSQEAPISEENGLLVHEGEPAGDLITAIETVRKQRDREVMGPNR